MWLAAVEMRFLSLGQPSGSSPAPLLPRLAGLASASTEGERQPSPQSPQPGWTRLLELLPRLPRAGNLDQPEDRHDLPCAQQKKHLVGRSPPCGQRLLSGCSMTAGSAAAALSAGWCGDVG